MPGEELENTSLTSINHVTNNNMKTALISSLLHVVELLVCLLASVLIVRFFDLGSDQTGVLAGIALNAVAAFARKSGLTPDFVNN